MTGERHKRGRSTIRQRVREDFEIREERRALRERITAEITERLPTEDQREQARRVVESHRSKRRITMERTDLAELARRGNALRDAISDYRDALQEGFDAALGEADPDDEARDLVPSNGDDYSLFESAVKKASDARFAVADIVGLLATQQGLRDFEDEGVEVG